LELIVRMNKKRPLFISLLLILSLVFFDGIMSFIDNPRIENELINEFENIILGEYIQYTSTQSAIVKRVIDADTIELFGGEKVRYIGIDSPESKHPTKDVECFAEQASEINKQLVEGKEVILENDVSQTDRYGRLLRYVYLIEDNGEKLFVNDYLVKQGFAKVSTFPPNIKYQELFIESQTQAQKNYKGLWGGECD